MARDSMQSPDMEADRGIPSVNTRRPGTPAAVKVMIVVAIVLAFLGAVGFVAVKKFQEKRQESKQEVEVKSETTTKLPKLDESSLPPADDTPLPVDDPGAQETAGEPGATDPANGAAYAGDQQAGGTHVVPSLTPEQQAAQLRQRRMVSPLIAYGAGADLGGAAKGVAAEAADLIGAPMPAWPQQAAEQPKPSPLAAALQGTETNPYDAQRLRDPSMTVTQASILPCVLNTALNSTVPGMVSCTITSDVYSTDGRVVLIERGSRVVGEYQNAQLQQGMNRVFVLWSRVETPKGVTVALDSPGADSLGRSGLTGRVNNHFWQRFGAGLLLSIVDDAVSYAVARQQERQDRENGVTFTNTSQATRSAAEIAVENSVGIPPTISVAQGAIVNIFVARDLYFGNIYGLRSASR